VSVLDNVAAGWLGRPIPQGLKGLRGWLGDLDLAGSPCNALKLLGSDGAVGFRCEHGGRATEPRQ
jgi:hypothetical protein